MSDDEGRSNGRATLHELLSDLSRKVDSQITTMAVISTEMKGMGESIRQIQTQLATVTGRLDSSDRELIMVRNRIEKLEARPVPIVSPEEHGAIRAALSEGEQRDAALREGLHDVRNVVQIMKATPPDFTPDEVRQAKRALAILDERGWRDTFSAEETADLRRIREEWQEEQETGLLLGRHNQTNHTERILAGCSLLLSVLIAVHLFFPHI